jgi:hypothetical protein
MPKPDSELSPLAQQMTAFAMLLGHLVGALQAKGILDGKDLKAVFDETWAGLPEGARNLAPQMFRVVLSSAEAYVANARLAAIAAPSAGGSDSAGGRLGREPAGAAAGENAAGCGPAGGG